MYYNYVYLNPFRPGKYEYNYLNMCFLYEPYYVGKGKNNRYVAHIKECLNSDLSIKENKRESIKCFYINRIMNECKNRNIDFNTYIIRFNKTTEELAFKLESIMINRIGILKDKSGPLTNLKDKGKKQYISKKAMRWKI